MQFITEKHIQQFGDYFASRGNFPTLINDLIKNSKTENEGIHFPKDGGVGASGADGMVHKSKLYKIYIPEGDSLWELGTNEDWQKKLKKDYEKTKEQITKEEAQSLTFVFVTTKRPDPATKKERLRELNEEGYFKEVRIIGASELAQWIEDASEFLNSYSSIIKNREFDTLEVYPRDRFFEHFMKNEIPLSYFSYGRKTSLEEFQDKYLRKDALRITSTCIEESIGFSFSALSKIDECKNRYVLLARDKKAIQFILEHCEDCDIITPFECEPHEHSKANKYGNVLIEALGNQYAAEAINLPLRNREELADALREVLQMDIEDSYNIAGKSKGSFYQLLRILEIVNKTPNWLNGDLNKHQLFTIALLGAVYLNNEEDRSFLELISEGKITVEKLEELCTGHDPILQKLSANTFVVLNPIEVWRYLVDNDGIDPKAIKEYPAVLLKEDKPELLEDFFEQFKRNFSKEKQKIYPSHVLISGMLKSLCALAYVAEEKDNKALKDVLYQTVHEVLNDASSIRLKSISSFFKLLAEISPEAFLDSLLKKLEEEDEAIQSLFEEVGGFMNSRAFYTEPVEALKGTAILPEYKFKTFKVLALLHEIDPGGTYANRPLETMEAILFDPISFYSAEETIKILGFINKVSEKSYQQLLLRNYQEITGFTIRTTYPFIYRIRNNSEASRYTLSDAMMMTNYSYESLLLSNLPGENKISIIRSIIGLPILLRTKILNRLRKEEFLSVSNNPNLYHALLLLQYRLEKDEGWGENLTADESKIIKALLDTSKPQEEIEEWRWLFERKGNDLHYIFFPDIEYRNLHEAMSSKRTEILKSIYLNNSEKELFEFLSNLENPEFVAGNLAQFLPEDKLVGTLERYLKLNPDDYAFIGNYVRGVSIKYDTKRAIEVANEFIHGPEELFLSALFGLPLSLATFKYIESLPEEKTSLYWTHNNIEELYTEDKEARLFAFKKLDEVRNLGSYFELLKSNKFHDVDDNTTAELLLKVDLDGEVVSKIKKSTLVRIYRNVVSSDEVSEEIKRAIELKYFLPLAGERNISLKRIQREILSTPKAFIEVIKKVHENEDDNDARLFMHRLTYEVKDNEKGADYQELEKWVSEILDLCKGDEIVKVVHVIIGQYLSSIYEKDRVIPLGIAHLIDKFESKEIVKGFTSPRGGYSTSISGVSLIEDHDKKIEKLKEELSEYEELDLPLSQSIIKMKIAEEEMWKDNTKRRKDNDRINGFT